MYFEHPGTSGRDKNQTPEESQTQYEKNIGEGDGGGLQCVGGLPCPPFGATGPLAQHALGIYYGALGGLCGHRPRISAAGCRLRQFFMTNDIQ